VVAHYKNVVAPQGASIVVVGDADGPTVKKAITKAFGDWSGSPTVQQRAPSPPAQDIHAIHLIDYPGSAQSAIAVARPAGSFHSPTRVEDKIFNRILGGAFVSRINMNLREDKGYTYGARSIFARLRRLGMFVTYSSVKTSTTLASLQEIQKEMVGIVRGKPITPYELNAAKKGLLLGLPAKYERIGTVADQVATLATYGLPPNWLQIQAKKIDAVSMKSVTESAKRNAVWDRMAIVVAGDRALIEDDLKKFGLPILLYDAQGNRLQSGVQSTQAIDR
jgi:zinc protease